MDKPQIGYIRMVSDNDAPPNRIREIREAIGMSQAELARRISMTAPALQKVEAGTRKLDQNWMRKIAPVLGVTPADLLPSVDNPWQLDDAEKELIRRLRKADQADRSKLEAIAGLVLEENDHRDAA